MFYFNIVSLLKLQLERTSLGLQGPDSRLDGPVARTRTYRALIRQKLTSPAFFDSFG